MGRGNASTTVAAIAPAIPIQNGKPGMIQTIRRQLKRKAELPSRVFLLIILIFPKTLPTRAAAISPTMMNEITATAIFFSKKIMLKTIAERMKLEPVKPLLSCFLSMGLNIQLSSRPIWYFFILNISTVMDNAATGT